MIPASRHDGVEYVPLPLVLLTTRLRGMAVPLPLFNSRTGELMTATAHEDLSPSLQIKLVWDPDA